MAFDFSKLSDQELEDLYQSELARQQPVQQPENDDRYEITKGFSSSVDNVKAMGGGLTALAGDALDSDSLRDYGMEVYERNTAEAAKNQGRITDFDQIKNTNDTLDYILQAIGSAAPTALTMIFTGGVSGAVGKKLASKAVASYIKERTGKKASEAAIKKFTQAALKRAAQKGQMTGAVAGSMGMETGSIYGEAADEGAEGAKAIGASLAGGALAGAFDAFPVMGVAKRFGFGSDFAKFAQERLSKQKLTHRVSEAAGVTGVKEFGTEMAQTGIEEITKAYILDRELPEDIGHMMLNAGFTGMAGGAALGAVGGIPRVSAPQEQQKINLPQDELDKLTTELDDVGNAEIRQNTAISNILGDPNEGLSSLNNEGDELDIVNMRATQALHKQEDQTKRQGEIDLAVEMEQIDQLLRAQNLQPNDKYARQDKALGVIDDLIGDTDSGLIDEGQTDTLNVIRNQAARNQAAQNISEFKNKRVEQTQKQEKPDQLSKVQKQAREEKGQQVGKVLIGDTDSALVEVQENFYQPVEKEHPGKKEQIDQLHKIQRNLRTQDNTPESIQQLKRTQDIVNRLKRGEKLSEQAIARIVNQSEVKRNEKTAEIKLEIPTKENVLSEKTQAQEQTVVETNDLPGLDQPFYLETDDYVQPPITARDIEDDVGYGIISREEGDKRISLLPESSSPVKNINNAEFNALVSEWSGGNGVINVPYTELDKQNTNISNDQLKRVHENKGKWWANQGLRHITVQNLTDKVNNGDSKFTTPERKVLRVLNNYVNQEQDYKHELDNIETTPHTLTPEENKAFDDAVDLSPYAPKQEPSDAQKKEYDTGMDGQIKQTRPPSQNNIDLGEGNEAPITQQDDLFQEVYEPESKPSQETSSRSLNRIQYYFEDDKNNPVSKTAQEMYDDIKGRIDIVRALKECI